MTAVTCFRQRIQYVYPCFRRCVFGGIPPLFFIRFRQISVYGNTCFRKRKCVASLRKHAKTFRKQDNFMFPTRKNDGNASRPWKTRGAIHATKIPTVRRGKVVHLKRWTSFFKTFPFLWVLDRNFRKFWLNGSLPNLVPRALFPGFGGGAALGTRLIAP